MHSRDPGEDILAAIWLSRPRPGVAPTPDVVGLDQATAEVLGYVARHARVRAGEALGTDYAAPAFVIAERLARESRQAFVEVDLTTWTAALRA